jgi:hypothetical protein
MSTDDSWRHDHPTCINEIIQQNYELEQKSLRPCPVRKNHLVIGCPVLFTAVDTTHSHSKNSRQKSSKEIEARHNRAAAERMPKMAIQESPFSAASGALYVHRVFRT